MAKLTLHVPDELVAAAKSEASERSVSVSKLVSDFFRSFKQADGNGLSDLAPITQSLVGCIKKDDGAQEQYIDYLEEKHS